MGWKSRMWATVACTTFMLVSLAATASVATAQDFRATECAMMKRSMLQRMSERTRTEAALSLFQAKSDPRLTHAYLRELRSAHGQQRLAPNFFRIAEHFGYMVQRQNPPDMQLFSQGGLLSLVEKAAASVPENAAPARPDPARLQMLRAGYDAAWRRPEAPDPAFTQRFAELRCPELPAAPSRVPPPPPSSATKALFNRMPTVTPASTAPNNPYDACTLAAEKLVDLERKQDEFSMLRWAIDDDYHDSFFASVSLRDAFKARKLAEDFHDIAARFGLDTSTMSPQQKIAAQPALRKQVNDLMAQARALTGRPSDKFINPDSAGLEDMLLDDEDEAMPPVDAAVRTKERQIEDDYFRAQRQTEQGRKQLSVLNCEDLPPPPPTDVGGPMKRIVTRTRSDKRGGDATGAYVLTYTDNSTRYEWTNMGVPIEVMTWNFFGIPESLAPGQTFTIQITGKLTAPSNYAVVAAENQKFASVGSHGLEVVSRRKAVLHKGVVIPGQFVFRVPLDAKWVSFGLIDNDTTKALFDDNLGRDDGFVNYCYGECPKMHFRMN